MLHMIKLSLTNLLSVTTAQFTIYVNWACTPRWRATILPFLVVLHFQYTIPVKLCQNNSVTIPIEQIDKITKIKPHNKYSGCKDSVVTVF